MLGFAWTTWRSSRVSLSDAERVNTGETMSRWRCQSRCQSELKVSVSQPWPEQHGVWHLDWLSGPNPGYGLTIGRSDRNWGSRAELENAARDFLRDVDPATCFLE